MLPQLVPVLFGGIRPTLDLNFLSGSLDQRITASGGANGYVVGPSGLLVPATAPRFDYDPITLACKGLLIEEQRTNLLLRSSEFDDASWEKSGIGTASSPIVTQNYALGPDGTMSADRVQMALNGGTTLSDFSRLIQTGLTIVTGTSYAQSCWIKATGAGDVGKIVAFRGAAGSGPNLVTLTADWQRVSATEVGNSAVTSCSIVYLRGSQATSDSADVLLWGAQLEAGALTTSYIPTTTAQVTRTADSASMTGTNFSSWYPVGGFSGAVEFDVGAVSGTRPIVSLDDNTSNQQIRLYTSGTSLKLTVTNGGVTQADLTLGTVAANTTYKAAFRVSANDFAAVMTGGSVQTDASGTVPTVDRARIGSDQAANYLNGHNRRIRIYRPMPNSVLQGLVA